jgi:hypothetical protein
LTPALRPGRAPQAKSVMMSKQLFECGVQRIGS